MLFDSGVVIFILVIGIFVTVGYRYFYCLLLSWILLLISLVLLSIWSLLAIDIVIVIVVSVCYY